jgi:hypothetical protein
LFLCYCRSNNDGRRNVSHPSSFLLRMTGVPSSVPISSPLVVFQVNLQVVLLRFLRAPPSMCLPAVLPLLLQVGPHLLPRALRLAVRLVSRPLVLQVLLRVVLPVRRLVALLPNAPVPSPALSPARFCREALVPAQLISVGNAHLVPLALLPAKLPVAVPVLFLAHHPVFPQ